jgi:homoserine dehydrogenase
MVNIGIIGVGLVGSELISQLSAYYSRNKTPTFKVIALMNSTKQILSDSSYSPLNLSSWKNDLNAKGTTPNLTSFINYLSETPTPSVVIDNTSSQEIANSYPLFIEKGLHIVTPNKKAFSGDLKLYKEIRKKADEKKRFIYYESTVGAGLPVLNTLMDLIRTGDKVIKIEGIFSGTLSYIFNEFSKLDGEKKKFSEIVKIAKEKGYTVSIILRIK